MADEYRVFDSPWGFDPSDISTPAQFWQGTADNLVPENWGHQLAAKVPNATLHLVEGGDHFLWYDHWLDIFDGMLSAGGPECP
jgi:pimeloyl-ACP methyl ester carboxylesterase